MSKQAHTPGPWHVNIAGYDIEVTQGGKWTSDQDDICYLNSEATGPEQDGFADPGAVVANAYLIAAAPIMLEACKKALEETPRQSNLRIVLEKAIAAARGEW